MEEESGVGEMLRMSCQTLFAAIFMLLSTALPALADMADPDYIPYGSPPILLCVILLSAPLVSTVLYLVFFGKVSLRRKRAFELVRPWLSGVMLMVSTS